MATRVRPRSLRSRASVGLIAAYLILAAYSVINLYPFLWMASGTVKTNLEMFGSAGLLPSSPNFRSLIDTWQQLDFFKYFANTVFYTLVSLFLILLIYPAAAFAFARLSFRGRDLLFALFVSILLMPSITTLIPLVLLEEKLQLVGTWVGLIIPTVNSAAPLSIFLLRNYFRALPHDLFEAAQLDGASTLRIYWNIYLPLATPAITTVTVFSLIGVWNSYLLPSLLISDQSMFTLPLGLFSLNTTSLFPQWNHLMAASFISVAPVIVVFVILQRYYISGLTVGAAR